VPPGNLQGGGFPIKVAMNSVNLFYALCMGMLALLPPTNAADQTLYLHSNTGQGFLNSTAPAGGTVLSSSSAAVGREEFKEVGRWSLPPAPVAFELVTASTLQTWIARRFTDPNGKSDNSEDTGTFFDVNAELLLNGRPVPGAVAQVKSLRNIKADPAKATSVSLPFGSFQPTLFQRGDVLSLRVLAKVTDQGGKSTAPGLTLFFDASSRSSRLTLRSFLVPEISITSAVVDEGNSGTTDGQLAVTVETAAERPVSVLFSTADGTAAIADNDYNPASGSITFAPGELVKTIHVPVAGDLFNEIDETVLVNLSHPVNGLVGHSGVLTIRNDDPEPSVNITSATITEGNSGQVTATLQVSLSAPSRRMVSVDYGTADGSATLANDDYLPANGVVTFAPGETTRTIDISIRGDTAIEPDETVLVNLGNPVHAVTGTGIGTVTIKNDDFITTPVISSPGSLALLNSRDLTVTGTVNSPNALIQVNGVMAEVNGLSFSARITLREGNNVITVVALDEHDQISSSSIQVTVDTVPPRISIDSPRDGAILSDPKATVTGIINDTVVGTVNGDQAGVVVNGIPAEVANRTFAVMDIPLVPGPNTITAVGTDRAGNAASANITVIYNTEAAARIKAVSGDGQSARIGDLLPDPLIVRATDQDGNPVPNKKIIFKVTQNDGVVIGDGKTARSLILMSDPDGRAQVQFRLGTRAGAGNNQVSAAIVGFEGEAMFCASATPSDPGLLVPDAGNNQVGLVSQSLPKPLVTIVVDSGNNRLHNVPVTFTVKEGGGSFAGQPSVTVNSDSDGRSIVVLTLGPSAGNDNNLIEANFPGDTGLPVVFVASGRVAGDPLQTSISGVVLDNSDIPVPGVLMRILGQPDAVRTDQNGFFRFAEAPIGNVRLIADGSTATRPGSWVWLQFDLVTIAGQDNDIGRPVRLLAMDMAHALHVDEAHGGILTLPQAPGYSLNIAPNSVTFPDGTHSGNVSVTIVHPDKMPDPPSFGQQPKFLVSIQPANAIFNPPAAMCIPNLDGLPPGQKTDMYSYDHDMERFISIGTGTVSEDGMSICSDHGNGVIKGGWHCGGDPQTVGTAANCGECQKCDGNDCVADPSKNGQPSLSDKCKICQDGQLKDAFTLNPPVSLSETVSFPNEPLAKVNKALEELKNFGVVASVGLLTSLTVTGTEKECCDPKLGLGKERELSGSGEFGSFAVDVKVYPPLGPIPHFGPREFDVGFATAKLEAELDIGVYVGAKGSVSGTIGFRRSCSPDPATAAGCFFASLDTKLEGSLDPRVSGNGSVKIDCLICDDVEVSGSFSLSAGKSTLPFSISSVSYNKDKCGTGLIGGVFSFDPLTIIVGGTFTAGYSIGGVGSTLNLAVNLLEITVSLTDGVAVKSIF
jgi:hypothetical protein